MGDLGVVFNQMRIISMSIIACFLVVATGSAQSDRDFSGTWKLNSKRSNLNEMTVPTDSAIRIEQSPASLTLFGTLQEGGASRTSAYPLDGRSERSKAGASVSTTVTKWEGSALLVNTIVSGPTNYTVMERWKRSPDGNTITVKRTLVRNTGEIESILVYENPQAMARVQPTLVQPVQPTQPTQPTRTAQPELQPAWTRAAPSQQQKNESPEQDYVVTAGTRVLLRLTNSINTKRTVAGDHVYLETATPVYVDGKLIIPAGSYVTGTVTESKRAGRVKGLSALNLQFESITLRNGVVHDLRSRAGSVDTKGNLDRAEGRIKGESNKGGDAGTVAKTTAAGTGIGAVIGSAAGHTGMGAGVGAAAGALGGLAGVLGSRGADVVLPQGTTMELVVDRDLRFTPEELRAIR